MSKIKKNLIWIYLILVFVFAAMSFGVDKAICQCTPIAYEFKLRNNGAFAENYSLSVDLFPEYATFSENPVSVNAGAIKSVFAYVNLPCYIYGDYDLNLVINAEKSKTTTKTPFKLNIVSCSDFNVELGNSFTITEEPTNLTFMAHKGAYSICEGEKEAVPILITNNVDASNYRLKLKGEKWSVLSGNYLKLLKNQQGIVYLSLMPPEGSEGIYVLKLTATNENTKTKTTTPIDIKAEKCYGLEISLPVEQDTVCGCRSTKYDLSVRNKGKFNEIVEFIMDAPRWVSLSNLSNQTLGINSSKEEVVELLVDVPCEKTGMYNIEIMGSLVNHPEFGDKALINLNVVQKDECYKAEVISDEYIIFDYSGAIKHIKIKNPIKKQLTYSISAEPEWVELSLDTVTIKPNEIVEVNFIIKPTADIKEGRYYGTIKLESDDVSFSKTINLELKKEVEVTEKSDKLEGDWYYVLTGILLVALILFLISMGKKIKKVKKGKKIERKKLFIYSIITLIILIFMMGIILIAHYGLFDYVLKKILWYRYYIYTLIALLIIILALIFIRKKYKLKAKEEIVEEEEIKVEAKKEKKVKKLKIEKFLGYVYVFLMVIIILGVIVYFFIYYKLIDKVKLIANYSTIDKIKEFITPYLNYLIGVVILLIVLIIILSIIKKIRKRKKKVKKTEAKKTTEKKEKGLRKNLFTYIVLLVIIGAIIYSFFYYDLIEYAGNFAIMYSHYIFAGVLVLVISIFILRFYKQILDFFMEEGRKKK